MDAAFEMLAREALNKILGGDKKKAGGATQHNEGQKVNLNAPAKPAGPPKKWKFC